MIKDYLKLKNYTEIKWKYFLLGVVFMALGALFNGISLSAIVPLMDVIIAGREVAIPENMPLFIASILEAPLKFINSMDTLLLLKFLLASIVLIFFLKGLFTYLNNYFFQLFGNRVLTDLRSLLYSKTMMLSTDYFSQKQSGEFISRLIYDVNLIMRALSVNLPKLIFEGALIVTYSFIIFLLDWKLSLFAILIFPPILYPILKMGKKLKKLGKNIQETYGRISNLIHEGVYGQQVIKAFNQQERIIEKFRVENENIFINVMSMTRRVLIVSPFTEVFSVLGASGLMYYGAVKVIDGSLTPGFLFLFFAALFSLVSPLKGVGNAYANLKHESSALPRIFAALNETSTVKDQGARTFNGLSDGIELKDVSFSYGNSTVLTGINLSVRRGESVGIVGSTGAGKTTLMNLIPRFYDPTTGQVFADGVDIREFTLKSLRDSIGLVTQEPILFRDTIRNNIILSDKCNEEKFSKAIEVTSLERLLSSLPNGYDTVVGERGVTLSGGQKQLISMARVIYKDPDILLLDEATASLDSNSEKSLHRALELVVKGRTSFIIAHRLSTLRDVDRIIVIQDGRIAEEGGHEFLMAGKGVYYKLWQIQFNA